MNILVFLHHGLGDVIMAKKLLDNINSTKFETVTLYVKSKVEKDFLEQFQFNNKTIIEIFNTPKSLKYYFLVLLKLIKLRFKKIDILLLPHVSSSKLSSYLIYIIRPKYSVSIANSRFAWKTIPTNQNKHKSEFYNDFFEVFNFKNAKSELQYSNDLNLNKNYNNYIIISPGSSPIEIHKRWPIEKYKELIKYIVNDYPELEIILLGSKIETEIIDEIYKDYADNIRVHKKYDYNIKESFSLISNAQLVLSACTSTAHMGSLLNKKLIALYGPTNHLITGPTNSNSHIIRLNYSCSPCYKIGYELGCGNPICMTDITSEIVYDKFREIIKQ